jgi:hypothetical protein
MRILRQPIVSAEVSRVSAGFRMLSSVGRDFAALDSKSLDIAPQHECPNALSEAGFEQSQSAPDLDAPPGGADTRY